MTIALSAARLQKKARLAQRVQHKDSNSTNQPAFTHLLQKARYFGCARLQVRSTCDSKFATETSGSAQISIEQPRRLLVFGRFRETDGKSRIFSGFVRDWRSPLLSSDDWGFRYGCGAVATFSYNDKI